MFRSADLSKNHPKTTVVSLLLALKVYYTYSKNGKNVKNHKR